MVSEDYFVLTTFMHVKNPRILQLTKTFGNQRAQLHYKVAQVGPQPVMDGKFSYSFLAEGRPHRRLLTAKMSELTMQRTEGVKD